MSFKIVLFSKEFQIGYAMARNKPILLANYKLNIIV